MARQALTGRSEQPPQIDSAPAIGLAWLVRLRWAFALALALVGAFASWFSGTAVEAAVVLATAGITVLSNVLLLVRRPASRLLLAAVLVLDGLLLTVTLRASGGAMNPFSVLFLVHVALAALLLDRRATWLVVGATCVGFGTLFLGSSEHGAHMEHHLRGMLAAYALAAAFVGYFVDRVARALERREREMLALRDWAARAEKVASLSALAAGAAHELGTPLGTIAVVAKELERAASGDLDRDALASDARLVREEAERCRRIIAKLASEAGDAQGAAPRRAPVADVLARVKASLDGRRKGDLETTSPDGAFVLVPDESLVQVLVSLVSNAFDAPSPSVALGVNVSGERVAFAVEDSGPGIPEDALARLGEPFFTMKEGRGMGLGLFLARSFAERVGGTLVVESHAGLGSTFVLEVPGGVA